MAASQLIAVRYTDLLSEGKIEDALSYLSDDIVYNTWMGVVYGKKNVTVFLRDNVRFLHHGRNFNRWKQVHHCLAPPFRQQALSDGGGGGHVSLALMPPEHQGVRRYLNSDGYDSQGIQKPEMKSNRIERRRELECAISQRQREMEDLHRRKAELEDELRMNSDALDAGNFAAVFPVLEYCGARPKKDLRQLPFEQVGNVKAEFEIAAKAVAQSNRTLQQQLGELKRRIEAEEKRCAKVKEKTKVLVDTTGVKVGIPARGQTNVPKALLNNNSHNHDADMTPEALAAKKKVIEKGIRAGRLLAKKKEDVVLSLSKKVESRHEMFNTINALNNDLRVTDRDIRTEKETLQGLIAEHDIVNAKLNAIMVANTSSSCLLLQEEIAGIKDEIEETANGTRRGQERVIKAQEYRLEQLERRLESIQKALKNNHMMKPVDAFLSQSWAEGGELMQLQADDDMYDIEAIIPAQEKCHPAIYNLLQMDKERLSRRISLLNVVVGEKENVIDALACKVEVTLRECQQAIQGLDQVAAGAAYEEKMQRLKAIEYIEERRVHCSDLFMEMRKLKLKAFGTPRRTPRRSARH